MTLTLREKVRLKFLDKCWRLWSVDYLRNLPSCVNKFKNKGSLKPGALVLVAEDAPTPKLQWPIGVIEKLYIGRDGKCRAVDVRTSKGMRTRDVRRLHVLEMTEVELEQDDVQSQEMDHVDPVVEDSIVDENVVDSNSNADSGVAPQTGSQSRVEIRSRRIRPVKPRLILDL